MSKTWPRVFRDPVHDLIAFEDNPSDRLLLDLINTKEVQRLRRIKQLGFTELVFPAANHSRFAHSLGVLQIARRMLEHFQRLEGRALDEEQRMLVLAASLLHDTGHGPFSHAFEKVTRQKHERFTLEIIQNESTEVNRMLRQVDPQLPQRLTQFFNPEIGGDAEGSPSAVSGSLPPYLTQIVSSQLDADRCDYLLRDSHATGTNYGAYDLSWLLAQLRVQADRRRFYLGRKALSAAEAYVFARFHMYRTVYFHKTTRAAEVMLRMLFQRFKELLDGAASAAAKEQIVPGAAPVLLSVFSGPASLDEYLLLDDYTVMEFLKACEKATDGILRELGGGLLHRRLFKAIDVSGVSSATVGEFVLAAQAKVPRDRPVSFTFVVDTPKDTPYKPYDPDAANPAAQIYVEDVAGPPKELSQMSDTVKELRKQYELVRYYFPASLRDGMDAVADETVRKGRA
jgi:HD superfamily phosphohydrolase